MTRKLYINAAPAGMQATSDSMEISFSSVLRQLLLLALPAASFAQGVNGYVENGTTGKPEAAHQVVLFTAQGSQGSAITNDQGAFQITPATSLSQHAFLIVKVVHDGIEYFQPINDRSNAKVIIYDAATHVNAVSGYLSVFQFQIKGTSLQVTELHALSNASMPPVTRSSADNLIVTIPKQAQIDLATVSGPDGGTIKLPLLPIARRKGEYTIDFPLKPGMTKYAINYQMPYDGKLVFRRTTQYPMRQIGVILPASMTFQSLESTAFHAEDGGRGTHEQVLENIGPNKAFGFVISGTGALSHYFRPLKPGETPMPAKNSAMTAPFPHAHTAAAKMNPRRVKASGPELGLAATILIMGVILTCAVMRKRILPTQTII